MKQYIVVIGTYDENTTEQIVLKEINVVADNMYQAHKDALYKCNWQEKQKVLRIFNAKNRALVFDFQKGFLKDEF